MRPPHEGLEAHFRTVHEQFMKDLPICNDRLAVTGAGFRPCGDWAVGIVVTPWFMNIFAAPFATQVAVAPGETQRLVLPVGEVDFLGAEIDGFGRLLSCSLFSPMDRIRRSSGRARHGASRSGRVARAARAAAEKPAATVDRRAFFRGAFGEREAAPNGRLDKPGVRQSGFARETARCGSRNWRSNNVHGLRLRRGDARK